MVSVVKRKKGKRFYFYLKHNSGTRQKEAYLGSEVPKNIHQRKIDFILEFFREEWMPKLRTIQKRYSAEMRQTPKKILGENLDNFAVHFTYNTQRVEGSTMTFRETADLLLFGMSPLQRPKHEMHEAQMHRKVFLDAIKYKKKITLKTILRWHEEIFSGTDHANAGSLRRYPIGVRGSRAEFPLWEDIPEELGRFFNWYNKSNSLNPAEAAAMAHYMLVSIHPFGDGNGRVSRLLMNCILHKNGYPMFIVRVSDRRSYHRALERSNLASNPIFFIQWFMKRYIRDNSRYIKT